MLEYVAKRGCACAKNVEVLRWNISLPSWDDADKKRISDFYSGIAARVVSFCEKELSEMAQREFDVSDDPKKRFRFPVFLYTLNGCVTYDDGAFISVRMSAELKRRGVARDIYRVSDAQTWQVVGETLLHPRQVFDVFGIKRPPRKELRSLCGVGFDGKEIFVCSSERKLT